MAETELFAIGQQPQKVARILSAGDNQDIPDTRIDQSLDGVIDHRLLVNRQQVLVGDLGQREQPASRTSRQNDALHKVS